MAETEDDILLSIGDLAARSGVPVSTIRAWEQRYGLLEPGRSPGGHRRYSVEDLRRMVAVRLLVSQGATLSAAAERVMAAAPVGSAATPDTPAVAPLPTAGLDPHALEAAYRATRALLHISAPADAVAVLAELVGELGGCVVAADEAGPDALPLDLSMGAAPPLLPAAEPYSIARLQLERVLPTVVNDARRAAEVARLLEHSRPEEPRR